MSRLESSQNIHYAFHVEYYEGLEVASKNQNKDFSNETLEYILPDIDARNTHLINLSSQSALKEKVKPTLAANMSLGQWIKMKTCYPGVLIGIGNSHKLKVKSEIAMGFTFDYVTGAPYLPGSSVKGILRAAFFYEDYIADLLGDKLKEWDISVETLKNIIFEGHDLITSNDLPMYQRDVFYDAQIDFTYKANTKTQALDKKILKLDYITPHRQDRELLELAEPNPIQMLAIAPNVAFEFRFNLKDTLLANGTTVTANDKLKLFATILEDFGIGAKTNVGYGALEVIEMSSERIQD